VRSITPPQLEAPKGPANPPARGGDQCRALWALGYFIAGQYLYGPQSPPAGILSGMPSFVASATARSAKFQLYAENGQEPTVAISQTFSISPRLSAMPRSPYDGTVWNNPGVYPSALQAGVTHHTYRSSVIGVDIGYNIYLPAPYFADPTRRFPVIYFLHGRGGNENSAVRNFAVMNQGASPTIYVFFNGFRNSKYRDALPGSPMYGVEMIDTSFITELIHHIDGTYRTTASKGGRAIQGMSMGGMGALRFAFKYPELFSSVWAFAPAIDDNASNVITQEPELMANMFNNDPAAFERENAQTFATNNAAAIRGLPIRVAIGSLDKLLPHSQALMVQLDSLQIAHGPLQIVNGVGHDEVAIARRIGKQAFQFAVTHFSLSRDALPRPGTMLRRGRISQPGTAGR
jgi:enterochelin esterase-like enzyme